MQVGDSEANSAPTGNSRSLLGGDVLCPPVAVPASSPRYVQDGNAVQRLGDTRLARAFQTVGTQFCQTDGEVVFCRMQAMPSQPGYDPSGAEESQQQQQTLPAGVSGPGEYMLPHTQLELGHSMARAAYPYADPYFGGIVAAYGAQAMIHPHMLGVQQARMPLPSEMMEEEPVYVNAKQYHGILRRRQSRAKAESENKLIKSRKPYLHESRHLHALRRARGCGGRFLNTKAKEEAMKVEGCHRSPEGQSSDGTHTPDFQASHSGQGMMGSSQDLQVGGLTSPGVSSLQQMGQYHSAILNRGHLGMVSGGNPSGVGFHSHHQPQSFHSSAFHPLPGGVDASDSTQSGSGSMVSNGSQQTAVATQ